MKSQSKSIPFQDKHRKIFYNKIIKNPKRNPLYDKYLECRERFEKCVNTSIGTVIYPDINNCRKELRQSIIDGRCIINNIDIKLEDLGLRREEFSLQETVNDINVKYDVLPKSITVYLGSDIQSSITGLFVDPLEMLEAGQSSLDELASSYAGSVYLSKELSKRVKEKFINSSESIKETLQTLLVDTINSSVDFNRDLLKTYILPSYSDNEGILSIGNSYTYISLFPEVNTNKSLKKNYPEAYDIFCDEVGYDCRDESDEAQLKKEVLESWDKIKSLII